jgi:hypothetical protein
MKLIHKDQEVFVSEKQLWTREQIRIETAELLSEDEEEGYPSVSQPTDRFCEEFVTLWWEVMVDCDQAADLWQEYLFELADKYLMVKPI